MTKGRSSNEARMPQPCNELAPEERADILRVRPQGAMCIMDIVSIIRSITMGNITDTIKKGMKDAVGAVKRAAEQGKDAAVQAVDKGKAAAARGAEKVKEQTDQAVEKVKKA